MVLIKLGFIGIFFVYLTAVAEESSEQAVKDVQKMLTDPQKRKQMVTTPEAVKATEYASEVSGGGTNEEELYKLSADVMGNMKNLSPEEMSEVLQKAQKDPEAFAKSLPKDIQLKIKEVASSSPKAHQQTKP